MNLFLIAIMGVVAGLGVLAVGGFFFVKRRLKRFSLELEDALQELCGSGIPPFSISLRPGRDIAWKNRPELEAVARQFEFAGYQTVNDYEIPQMPEARLRALWHPGTHSYAVIYDHDTAGVFADVCRFFQDDALLLITAGPETGLDYPENVKHLRVEIDLMEPAGAHTLHEAMLQESGGQVGTPMTAEQFPQAFIAAYTREMEWRIARGGPTPEEVRRAALAGGQEAPADEVVAMVRSIWRAAISEHFRAQTQQHYLAHNPMSAQEWELARERIRIVNDWDDPQLLAEELAWSMIEGTYETSDEATEERLYAEAHQRMQDLFKRKTTRAGFAAAQQSLPEKVRLELLSSIEEPAGDVYLEPERHDTDL